MTMTLHQLAIHELVKNADSNEAELRLSDNLLLIDEKAEELIGKLNKTFIQKNEVLNGHLAAPEDALFPGYFHLLEEDKFSAEAFLQFSRDSMQALQLSLQGIVGAKGGYLVYAFYSTGEGAHEQHLLGIFLVRDTNGLVFTTGSSGSFQLNPSTYLDIDRMALACRIILRKGEGSERPHLEVIKHARTQKEISDYFLSWLGIEESVSNKELTHHFLEAVAAVPLPVDEETGAQMETGVFREQLANFAMKSPGKVINIPAFEEKFYGEEKPIQAYLSEQEVNIQDEFRFDRQAVREYNFHKFKGQGLYFGCKHAFLLSGEVRVEGEQVIIDNPELAEQIMAIIHDL
ncbi:MAG: nucleoid-associated protein [Lewinella sp.]|jgi:nucleoid-associated protein YejK|uniref:nucleoid-associated protein n=1 Tax=Lewinella sp. TaxID=2004506 RepID=UPI003D6C2994